MHTILHAAGLLLFNEHGEIVFVRKRAGANHWSIPKGRFADETPLEAALWHTREQTGIPEDALEVLSERPTADYHRPCKKGVKHITAYLATTIHNELVPEKNKYEAIWAGIEFLKQLPYKEDRHAVKDAFATRYRTSLPADAGLRFCDTP